MPASSSEEPIGLRGARLVRATTQPSRLSTAKPASARTGQVVAGGVSGGSGTEGADGQAPASAKSSKITAVQSQKPRRLR